MNSFRDLAHPAEGLKPVKQMLLQEFVYFVIIVKLSTTLLKMVNPVETCILEIWRETLVYLAAVHVGCKCTWRVGSAYILLQTCQQNPETAIDQRLMCLLLIHQEIWLPAPGIAKKEVAK